MRAGWQSRYLGVVAAVVPLLASAARSEAQAAVPCVRIGFGTWQPALDWTGAGHPDSSSRVAGRIQQLRDSVFGGATRTGGDQMQWFDFDGKRRLLLFPAWWPAGVMITFDPPALGDTLAGEAEALVADLRRPTSRTRARVIRRNCSGE